MLWARDRKEQGERMGCSGLGVNDVDANSSWKYIGRKQMKIQA